MLSILFRQWCFNRAYFKTVQLLFYCRSVPWSQSWTIWRAGPGAVLQRPRGEIPESWERLPRGLRGQRGQGGLWQQGRAQDIQRSSQGGRLHHRRGREDWCQQRTDGRGKRINADGSFNLQISWCAQNSHSERVIHNARACTFSFSSSWI